MAKAHPKLHLLCGKVAAGKSTLTAKFAAAGNAILILKNEWLAALYTERTRKPKDDLRYAAKLRAGMAQHVVQMLNSGTSVFLDFLANTTKCRLWMRGLIDPAEVDHLIHVLMPPDEVGLARSQKRNKRGSQPFALPKKSSVRSAPSSL